MEEITITFTKEEITILAEIVSKTSKEGQRLAAASYGEGNISLEELKGVMALFDSLAGKFKPYEDVNPEPKKSKFQQRLDDSLASHRK